MLNLEVSPTIHLFCTAVELPSDCSVIKGLQNVLVHLWSWTRQIRTPSFRGRLAVMHLVQAQFPLF